jgi:hypothetical protein
MCRAMEVMMTKTAAAMVLTTAMWLAGLYE